MPHDINQMVYVGKEPWHGLGTSLPANGSYEEIVHAASFYKAVEWPLHSPPMEGQLPDKKALFREDTGDYLSTVSTSYEVVQFEEVAARWWKRLAAWAASSTRPAPWAVTASGGCWAICPSPCTSEGTRAPIKSYVLG